MLWTPPASAKSLVIAPLSKGMRLDLPGQHLEDGAFLRLQNIIPSTNGLFRRPGYGQFAAGDSTPYRPVDYVTIWDTDGGQVNILITDKVLYRISPVSGFTEIQWRYSTGTVAVSGVNVVGSGTAWTLNDIYPGDILRVGSQEGVVSDVVDPTHITLVAATITNGSGLSYYIQRAFGPGLTSLPDWAVKDGVLLIADGKRKLMSYNPDTDAMGYWTTLDAKYPSSKPFAPAVVAVFDDRVWQGHVIDADGTFRQRMWWSKLADTTDFSEGTNYLDLPYVLGALRKLLPLGGNLIAYFDDAVYIGSLTNYVAAPVRFERVETGGAGIMGNHAVLSFLNAHFFVGADDIYVLTVNGVERIGSPILRESVRLCQEPEFIYVCGDPFNSSVLFGIPGTDEWIENIWRFEFRAKAWALDVGFTTRMIANPLVSTGITWLDLAGLTWASLGAIYPKWTDMHLSDPRRFVFLEQSGVLWKGTEADDNDFTSSPINVTIITKDHSFDLDDMNKIYTRFGLKIDWTVAPTVPILLPIEYSVNKGRTWRSVGSIQIPVGRDEGAVSFQALGSTIRFRITSASLTTSYEITEYSLRARLAGEELRIDTQG